MTGCQSVRQHNTQSKSDWSTRSGFTGRFTTFTSIPEADINIQQTLIMCHTCAYVRMKSFTKEYLLLYFLKHICIYNFHNLSHPINVTNYPNRGSSLRFILSTSWKMRSTRACSLVISCGTTGVTGPPRDVEENLCGIYNKRFHLKMLSNN